MAAPTLSLLVSTSINTAESTTGWTQFDTLDSDIKKEGNNGITGTFRTNLTAGYYTAGTAPATAANKTFRMWVNTTNVPYMETAANGGYELLAYDGTTTQYITVFSSDDYYGGWFQVVIDMNLFTSLTLSGVLRWGIRIHHTTNAKNVDNMWVDALKYLDGYSMTGGSSSDPITLATIEEADRGTTTLYGYGVLTTISGVYFCTGEMQFGTGTSTMYFEMDGDILIFEDKPVAAGLYKLLGVGSGSNITIKNSVINSAGSTDATRYILDFDDANLASLVCTDNVIVRASTIAFKSGQTVTGNVFDDCGQITHGGADMDNCTVKNYEGTANTSALIYNVNADPDGEMDGMSFAKGTAATHAIEFGTTSPLTMTLRNIDFSGYNASDSQNDSTFHFKRTTGDVTLNLIGCSGNFSYRSDGANVTIVTDPVSLTLTVKDNDTKALIVGAQVFIEVTNGVNFPYLASVTITGSGTTATVAHTAHGLATGDWVRIRGANEDVYNGRYQITVTGANAYTYTTSETIPTSPATGTITSTFVLLTGLTNGSGQVTDSWSITSDQPFSGWVRKSTSSPYYRQSDVADTLLSTASKDITVLMISDE